MKQGLLALWYGAQRTKTIHGNSIAELCCFLNAEAWLLLVLCCECSSVIFRHLPIDVQQDWGGQRKYVPCVAPTWLFPTENLSREVGNERSLDCLLRGSKWACVGEAAMPIGFAGSSILYVSIIYPGSSAALAKSRRKSAKKKSAYTLCHMQICTLFLQMEWTSKKNQGSHPSNKICNGQNINKLPPQTTKCIRS